MRGGRVRRQGRNAVMLGVCIDPFRLLRPSPVPTAGIISDQDALMYAKARRRRGSRFGSLRLSGALVTHALTCNLHTMRIGVCDI